MSGPADRPGTSHGRLSPLDATFLELEEDDSSAHMHIGAMLVFESRPGGTPGLDEVREEVARRLEFLPRYRQRLSDPATGGLRWPEWIEEPELDIAAHVRASVLPAPGGPDELEEWSSDFFSHRLDRSAPLWEMIVLDGLEGGRWALATKIHHCLVDGVGSVDIGMVLLDTEEAPDPETEPPAAAMLTEAPAGHGRSGVRRLLGRARDGLSALTDPAALKDALRRAAGLAEVIIRDEVVASPPSSLNVPIGERRRFRVEDVSLQDIKEVARAYGGKVNDVVLAMVAGGLNELITERGEDPPEQGLRAMVPVNVRDAAERLTLGNKITSLFVDLPVAEADPAARLARVIESMAELKRGRTAEGAATIIDLAGLAPPAIHAFLARSLYATRLFNITVTNVPGPRIPLWAFGSRLAEVHPLVPLAAEHALGVACFSYDGRIFFGLNADRRAVPDLGVFARGLRSSLEALRPPTPGPAPSGEVARERGRRSEPEQAGIVVAGGGVAALEAAMSLREHVPEDQRVTLLAPDAEFTYRPMSVGEPFGVGEPRRIPLDRVASDAGAVHRRAGLARVDVGGRVAHATDGRELHYEALLVAIGARGVDGVPGAVTFRGSEDAPPVRDAVDGLLDGSITRLAIAVPPGTSWPLPAYELALLAARRAPDGATVLIATPEPRPLAVFGEPAADEVERILEEAGVEVHTGIAPTAFAEGELRCEPGPSLRADRVVALPRLEGIRVEGLPGDSQGFLPVDPFGAVLGAPGVWAAGDITDFPIKQGGLAAQQAEAAAGAIASVLGHVPPPSVAPPRPFKPVLRGMLVTGQAPRYFRRRPDGSTAVATETLWWPPGKIAGGHLSAYVAGQDPEAAALIDRYPPSTEDQDADTDHRNVVEMLWRLAEYDEQLGDRDGARRALDAIEALEGMLPGEWHHRHSWTEV